MRKNVTANAELMRQLAGSKLRSRSPGLQKPKRTTSMAWNDKPDISDNAEKNVSVEALDWCELLLSPTASRESRFRLAHADPPDAILAADCVYNPALIPAFVNALSHYARPGRTVAVVAVELRSSEVVQEFLAAWIGDGCWEVWRLEDEEGDGWLGPDFAIWVGWKAVRYG